jgi:Cd2+/Zn2+-exporting ATPase
MLSGVASAALNFTTRTLTVEVADADNIDSIVHDTNGITKRLEPYVVVREKNMGGASKIADRIEPGTETAEDEVWGTHGEARAFMTSKGYRGYRIILGAAVFLAALLAGFPFWVKFGVCFAGYLIVGGDILLRAGRNILKGRVFDENFLMSIATIGAFAIGEFPEGVAVMLFYQVGEVFQEAAVNRSRKSITALMDIRPDFANLKIGGELRKVVPGEVSVGDIILVRPGEKAPLDGRIIDGASMLDTSALTGESLPREVAAGDDILSGSINKNGLLTVEVTKLFGESTVSKILELVQNAAGRKAPTESFITKFARYYTPAVVFAAVAIAVLPPLLIGGATFAEWINRALVFLVVSCPCALVISIPLSFFGGIGGASRNGILVKGGNYLEALGNIDTVVFDKTGTLTKGVFAVVKAAPTENMDEAGLLRYAAYAEGYSTHPIALSILKAYGRDIDRSEITGFDEIGGFGIMATIGGRRVLAGNANMMARESIACSAADEAGTIVHIAVDGKYAGYLVIADALKPDSRTAVQALKRLGVKKLVMLTGDNKAVGEAVGRELGLDEVHAGLLPDQKVEKLELLDGQKGRRGKLVFVGDGINDAPVLSRADVGVAMGGLGSDAAIEAADVVLMTDEPSKLVTAIRIARRTRTIVWQNIIFALTVKAVVLALGAGGIATIWEAVFADVGVTLLAVLNSLRAMKTECR